MNIASWSCKRDIERKCSPDHTLLCMEIGWRVGAAVCFVYHRPAAVAAICLSVPVEP